MNNILVKNILIGISGGIAAYKSAELVRLFKKAGYEVRVCMTAGACKFITPLTMQALSGNPVHSALLDTEAEAGMGHIELARWADLVVIAPATADLISRLRAGMANDLLSTVVLATDAPVHIAPAMNQQMWTHPATQENIVALHQRHQLHGPAAGEQACGDFGYGRMLEPQEIFDGVIRSFGDRKLSGHRLLITAGPTREPLDPVRYLTNRSSGKMGYAIAEAASAMGAEVVLVSGPTRLSVSNTIKRIDIETAEEMLDAVTNEVAAADLFISAAAVSDYRLKKISSIKMKKNKGSDVLQLDLVENPDVLATTSHGNPELFTVGFAAETNDVIKYAAGKLKKKGLDLIVANQVGAEKGFDVETNQVDILTADGNHHVLPEMNKSLLAYEILAIICQYYLPTDTSKQ
jgi:phosphopantothenoylcysteine decarboxylase/phosphopantothenate--cysteine ligase